MELNIKNGKEACDKILRCGGLSQEEIDLFWGALAMRMCFAAVGAPFSIIGGIIKVAINCDLPDESDKYDEKMHFCIGFMGEGQIPLYTGNTVHYRYGYRLA